MSIFQLLAIIPAGLVACLLGGSFGVLVLANLSNQRSANQIFPFLIFPQFFLSGIFNPIHELPLPLYILSRISPMTYAVDFIRNIFYLGTPEYSKVVLYPLHIDILIIGAMLFVMLFIGTWLFVKNERNR